MQDSHFSGLTNSMTFLGFSVNFQVFFIIFKVISKFFLIYICCDMGQNDTIGKIELNPSFVLSSDNTNYKNEIQ